MIKYIKESFIEKMGNFIMEKLKMEKNFRMVELVIRMDKLSIMEDLEIIRWLRKVGDLKCWFLWRGMLKGLMNTLNTGTWEDEDGE